MRGKLKASVPLWSWYLITCNKNVKLHSIMYRAYYTALCTGLILMYGIIYRDYCIQHMYRAYYTALCMGLIIQHYVQGLLYSIIKNYTARANIIQHCVQSLLYSIVYRANIILSALCTGLILYCQHYVQG